MMTFKKKIVLAALVFVFAVLLISSFFGKKGLVEIYQTRKKYRILLQDIERLEKEKHRLEEEIRRLKTDPKAVEEEARKKLWMMKPDEKVIVKKDKNGKNA